MLRHESDNPIASLDNPSGDAEHIRVGPDELVRAIAALEDRQKAEARLRGAEPGMIPLGEAVTSLALSATPSELWAEVQRQRTVAQELAKRPMNAAEIMEPRPKKSRMFELTLSIGFLFVAVSLLITNIHIASVDSSPATPQSETATENGNTSATDAPTLKKPGLPITVRTPHGVVIRTLDEIADNVPVRCAYSTISSWFPESIQSGSLPEELNPDPSWTLIKHNGKPYLRGWIQVAMSRQAMTDSTLVLFDSPTSPGVGKHPVPVTLALDTLHCIYISGQRSPTRRAWEKIQVNNAQPDDHAWEKP